MNLKVRSFEDYKETYKKSVERPEEFWSGIAEEFKWRKKWDKVLSWDFKGPDVRWFEGGKLNITENCLDRHIQELGDKPAIICEPNDPNENYRILSYNQLLFNVEQFANVLKNNDIVKGDRVC